MGLLQDDGTLATAALSEMMKLSIKEIGKNFFLYLYFV